MRLLHPLATVHQPPRLHYNLHELTGPRILLKTVSNVLFISLNTSEMCSTSSLLSKAFLTLLTALVKDALALDLNLFNGSILEMNQNAGKSNESSVNLITCNNKFPI